MYYLKRNVLGKVPKIELTEKEFLEIQNAKKTLRCALAIEEKFEILLSNLKELEGEIAKETSSNQALMSVSYTGPFSFRILLERRLANLLTSTKTYVDQVPSNVRDSFVESTGILEEVKKYFCDAYDSSIDYRVMEMLRNHVQHNGIAIHSVQHNLKRTDNGMKNEVLALSKKSELVQNRRNKRATLNEIHDSINLLGSCQEYVAKLTEVHRKIRDKVGPNTLEARLVFEKAIDRYKQQGGDPLGLNAFHETKDESVLVSIFLEFDDIRINLHAKNLV
ncbi:hypothetical protein NB541_01135 [Vibrio parahaemolyticus]|uniref:hypothetical protein n=1 Tax=Vibrio parahaemolyticus TaxID=670 RepID=UPI00215CEEEE|nr:hypothetical protein [Vibrio parahaemolyticus]MCR9953998.1 hypothetical protein [Vibrio parahaemolyticus]